jgi:hypothetical protein
MTYQDEFRALLNKHEIRFDERYVVLIQAILRPLEDHHNGSRESATPVGERGGRERRRVLKKTFYGYYSLWAHLQTQSEFSYDQKDQHRVRWAVRTTSYLRLISSRAFFIGLLEIRTIS